MTSSSIGPFCNDCAALDVQSLLYVRGSEIKRAGDVSLGLLEDIIRRSDDCRLCSLIAEALKERYKRTPARQRSSSYYSQSSSASEIAEDDVAVDQLKEADASTQTDEVDKYGMPITWLNKPIECFITPKFFCRQDHGGNFEEAVVSVFHLAVTISPCPWPTFSSTDAVTLHAIWEKNQQGADGATSSIQTFSPAGSGRKVGSHIDMSMVRGWLHQCEEVHGYSCACPNWASNGDEQWDNIPLRVIDVRERRVVDLPPQGRYIALSYVWGQNRDEVGLRSGRCLTSQNLAQLQELNGLSAIALPETIQDAFSLTSDLGERYLWVDALCILQDDVNDLDVQTSRMDLVYSGALLTILAACGNNSESGLVGMPGRPRDVFHRSIPISPDGLWVATTAALSDDQSSVQLSAWNQRGWTFQERLLSRRALFFTPSQIYWHCESCTWDEETILEPTEPNIWVLPQALKCNDEWDDGDAKFSQEALGTYITQYNTRKLTFSSDAHSAFLGIVRRYEHLHKKEVFWGLPTERLDQNLTWKYGKSRRQEMQPMLLNGSVHHVPYPSWSWLGWHGFIGASLYNKYLSSRTKSELIFYSLMSDGTIRSLENSGSFTEEDGLTDDSSLTDESQDASLQPATPDNTPRADLTPSWKGDTTITGPISIPNEEAILKLDPVEVLEKRMLSLSLHLPVHDTGRLVFRTSHAQVKARFSYNTLSINLGDSILELPGSIPFDAVPYEPPAPAVAPDPLPKDDPEPVSKDDAPTTGDSSLVPHIDPVNIRFPQSATEMTLDLVVISRFYEIGSIEDTGKLNIMILQETEFQAGVWSRHGVAVIEEKDWLQFERSWDTIILA